ncbi:AtpZ/AtpI family protein [Patescibacteria group bacterium]|nr:AtpZ/AtpI family protein [Patescibacteria group bacterium]
MESDKKDNKNTDKNEYMRLALTIFVETTGWIAFPVIGALFLGRWLDEKQGTYPLYFLGITGLAFVISSVGITITGVKYMKKIEKEEELKKKQNNESRNRK